MSDINKEQQEFINLLLTNKDKAISWAEKGPDKKFFDSQYEHILAAIKFASFQNSVLTKKMFMKFLETNIKDKRIIAAQENLFDKIHFLFIKEEDFNVIKENIIEHYVNKKAISCIEDWHKSIKEKKNKMQSLKKLTSSLEDLYAQSADTTIKPIIFESISDFAPTALSNLKTKSEESDEVEDTVKTGIAEVDNSIVTGIAPGTMTLFGADVGNYKTTMMMNIAMNIWQKGHNVLFVPLEMPRELLYWKMMSRESGVPFDHILKPKEFLTKDDWEKIKDATVKISGHQGSSLYIMEKLDGHTTVSEILRQIERHADVFQPKAIVVDYVGILAPDAHMRNERDDVKIGLMLKSLRQAGKPGALTEKGFGTISGVQIGRDALKRIRRLGVNKTSFHSEDLRGSHDYSADADNIFAQMKDPAQPNNRLLLFHLKTRYGKPIFSNGESKVSLHVQPNISLIRDLNSSWMADNKDDILNKVDSNIDDILDFDDPHEYEDLDKDLTIAEISDEDHAALEALNDIEIDDFDNI